MEDSGMSLLLHEPAARRRKDPVMLPPGAEPVHVQGAPLLTRY